MKKLIRLCLKRMPGKRGLLRFAAILPPGFKRRPLVRLFEAVAKSLSSPMEMETNLGMRSGYRVRLSSNVNPALLFGTPLDYCGERGPIYLAGALSTDCSAFLDIGAHHGYFSFYVAHKSGKQFPIYFFEPNDRLHSEICHNAGASGLALQGFPSAIGANCGTTPFYINLGDDSSSSLSTFFQGTHPTKKVEVPITTFAEFARSHQLENALVKVDIENAEQEFLEGVGAEGHRIRYLIMEVLLPAIKRGFLVTGAERLGMHAYYINDFCLEYCPGGKFTYVPPQYNWLFCRLSPDELATRLKGTRFSVKECGYSRMGEHGQPHSALGQRNG